MTDAELQEIRERHYPVEIAKDIAELLAYIDELKLQNEKLLADAK